MDFVQRRLVREVRGIERADQRDVIDLLGKVRQGIGNPHAALAALGKLERAFHQRPGRFGKLDFAGDLREVILPVPLVELVLGIEQVHLARAAVHEQVDDGFGPRRDSGRRGFRS